VWSQWLQHRPNWLLQFRYYDTLRQRLNQDDLKATAALYVQAIARDLEQVLQTAPDLATPSALQQQLDQLSQQLNRYIRLHLQLEKMKDLVAMLEGEQRYEWEEHAEELAQRSQMLLPTQDTKIQTMQDEINARIETLRAPWI
jgi:rRNA-processing protein FCF1